jgi:SAM-dependent methyltransferase
MAEPPANLPRVYIDEHAAIHSGAEAERLLKARGDGQPALPQRGILRVDPARWQEAQRYERRTWLEKESRAFSDRNEDHRRRFDGYRALQGRRFQNAIELGCGPFTNMRLIVQNCHGRRITLLDPLLNDYLMHAHCQYRGGRLGGALHVSPFTSGSLRHVARHIRNNWRIGGLWGRAVTLVPSMIETYTPTERFDLMVVINVLEHCQDAALALERINALLQPGGLLVFHDRLYQAHQVARLLEQLVDVGHPLRVDRSVIEDFLKNSYRTLFRDLRRVQREFLGVHWDEDELYTIAEKLP